MRVCMFRIEFPKGRDSATFRDNGTEVPSLSRDKGTTRQAKNLAKGRDGPGQPKSGTGHRTKQDRAEKDIPKQENDVLKQENDVQKQEICFFWDVPGQRSLSRDICSCPCPGTKGQEGVPSHGNTNLDAALEKICKYIQTVDFMPWP